MARLPVVPAAPGPLLEIARGLGGALVLDKREKRDEDESSKGAEGGDVLSWEA